MSVTEHRVFVSVVIVVVGATDSVWTDATFHGVPAVTVVISPVTVLVVVSVVLFFVDGIPAVALVTRVTMTVTFPAVLVVFTITVVSAARTAATLMIIPATATSSSPMAVAEVAATVSEITVIAVIVSVLILIDLLIFRFLVAIYIGNLFAEKWLVHHSVHQAVQVEVYETQTVEKVWRRYHGLRGGPRRRPSDTCIHRLHRPACLRPPSRLLLLLRVGGVVGSLTRALGPFGFPLGPAAAGAVAAAQYFAGLQARFLLPARREGGTSRFALHTDTELG